LTDVAQRKTAELASWLVLPRQTRSNREKTLGRDIMTLTGVAGVDPSVPASQDDRSTRSRSIASEIEWVPDSATNK
jgi:hypothetical protein